MEANILPVAAGLIACPDRIVTLRTSPSVKGNDVRADALVASHNVVRLLHAAKLEGVSVSYPCNVCLKCRYTGIYFRIKVAERMPVSSGI